MCYPVSQHGRSSSGRGSAAAVVATCPVLLDTDCTSGQVSATSMYTASGQLRLLVQSIKVPWPRLGFVGRKESLLPARGIALSNLKYQFQTHRHGRASICFQTASLCSQFFWVLTPAPCCPCLTAPRPPPGIVVEGIKLHQHLPSYKHPEHKHLEVLNISPRQVASGICSDFTTSASKFHSE